MYDVVDEYSHYLLAIPVFILLTQYLSPLEKTSRL